VTSTVARAPFTRRAWLDTIQVCTGLAVAIITFSVMLCLSAVGVVVLPTVVLVAVPFIALLACADVFGIWQRSRLAAFAGVRIPATTVLPRGSGSLISDLLTAARTASSWRQIGYHLVVGPAVVAVGGLVVAFAWGGALIFTLTPLEVALLQSGAPRTPAKIVAATALGLVLFFVAPWLARGAAMLDTASARAMLGPTRADELRRLTESRAAAVSAADAERRRIERDLHDGTQQRLVSMAMRLGLARATLEDVPADDMPAAAMAVIERAHEDAKEALKELRDLVQGLHPAILTDRGLDAALSGIAARAPFPVELTVSLNGAGAPAATEAVAFFIVSEALSNVAKHAHATSASVTVAAHDDMLTITIADDGRGGARAGAGSGLTGLQQRAASVDGTLHIDSPLGGPTVITAELPCES
jgi:signal transduction histidine kinase